VPEGERLPQRHRDTEMNTEDIAKRKGWCDFLSQINPKWQNSSSYFSYQHSHRKRFSFKITLSCLLFGQNVYKVIGSFWDSFSINLMFVYSRSQVEAKFGFYLASRVD